MNTTQTFWDVDGVSLQTYAYNIQTWGGDAQAPPPLRGDDVLVPHQAGRTWTPRVPDSRTITFGMWVVGANKDGSIPESGISRELFERNWAMLRKLLWTPRRQIKLTKRFKLFGSSKIHTATAMAQFSGGLNPTMTGRTRAMFTVDLLLSDPFFYGDEIELDIDPQEPVQEFEVLGDDRTTAITTEVTGFTKSLRVTNSTDEDNPVWFQYNRALEKGQKATVDAQQFTATHDVAGAATPSSGNITNEGSDHWMELNPGIAKLGVSEQDVPSRGTVWTNLSTNPSFERIAGTSTVRSNGVLNPSFERASTNALNVWRTNLCPTPDMAVDGAKSFAAPALIQQSAAGDNIIVQGGPFDGGYRALEIISSTQAQAPGITFYGVADRSKGISITGGLTYAASLYVRGESQPFVGVPLQLFMRWYGPNNQNTEAVSATLNGSQSWQRASHVAVAPIWATEVIFGVRVAPSVITGGTVMSIASVLLENSSEVLPFFSGSTKPDFLNAQYAWKGTAGISQSIMSLSAPITYRNDVINPSFESAKPLTELVVNRATNPGFENPSSAINQAVNPALATAENNWGVGIRTGESTNFSSGLTRTTTGGPPGIPNYIYSLQPNLAPDPTRWYIISSTGSTNVKPGQAYTISMWGRSDTLPASARLRAYWGPGNYTVGPISSVDAGKWFKRTLTVVAPANATALAIELEISDFQPDGRASQVSATGVMAVPVANVNSPYTGNFFAGEKSVDYVRLINRMENPSFESASGTARYRLNHVTNPRLSPTTTGWSSLGFGAGTGTLTYSATGGQVGGTWTKTWDTTDSAAVNVGFATTNKVTFGAGTKQAVSAYMRSSFGYRAVIQAVFYNTAGDVIATSNGELPYTQLGSSWTQVKNVFIAPDDAVSAIYRFTNTTAANAVATGKLEMSGGTLIESGQLFRTYFDGSTASTGEFADYTSYWIAGENTSGATLEAPAVATTGANPNAIVVRTTQYAGGLRPYAARLRPLSTLSGINSYIEPGLGYAANTFRNGIVAGRSYTIMATIIRPADLVSSVAKSSIPLTAAIMYTLPDGVVYSAATPSAPSTAGKSLVRARVRVPSNATSAWVRLTSGYAQGDLGTSVLNEVIFDDVALVEQEANSSPPVYDGPYFDGSSFDTAENSYTWAGTPDLAASFQNKTGYVGTTNLFTNPSFESVTGTVPDKLAFATNVTPSSATSWAARGTKSLKLTPSTTNNNSYIRLEATDVLSAGIIQPEVTYRMVATLHLDAPQTGSTYVHARKIVVEGSASGTVVSTPAPNVAGDYQLELVFRVSPEDTYFNIRLYNGAAQGGGDVYWDQVAIFQNDHRPYLSVTGRPVTGTSAYYAGLYFDGNTVGSDEYLQVWDGDAHASRSFRRAPYAAATLPDGARALQSSDWASSGTQSLRIIPVASTADLASGVYLGVPTPANSFLAFGMVGGQTYTASVRVRIPTAIVGTLNDHALSLALDYADSTYTHGSIYSSAAPNVPGEYTLRFTFTVPSNPAYVALRFIHGGILGSGNVYLDDLQVVNMSNYAGEFFTGNTVGDSDYRYAWRGEVNDSQSIRFASPLATGTANGIFAVQASSWASSGQFSARLSPVSSTSNDTFYSPGGDIGALRFGLAAGRYTVMAKRRLASPITGSLHERAGKLAVFYKVGTGTYQSAVSSAFENVAGTTDVRVTVTLPAGVTEAFVRLYHGGLVGSGDVWWDDLLITPVGFDSDLGYTGPYFDGDTPNTADYNYSWSTVNDRFGSTTARRAIAVSQVASNSLVSSSGVSFMSNAHPFSTDRPRSLQIMPTGASNFTFATLVGTVMLPNKSYLLRGRVYLEKPQTGKLNANARKITVAWSGYPGYLTTVFEREADNATGWTEYVAIVNTPPTGSLTAVYLWNGASETDGSVWWDDVMVTDSADEGTSYFDGSMKQGDYVNSWTGTPGASTSIQSAAGVAGVSSSPTAAAYQASEWALSGTKSLRVTPTSLTSNDTYASVNVDLPAGTYTIMATVRLKDSLSGSLSDRSRRIFMADENRQYISHAALNVAGEHEIRWNITTTGRVLLFRLYNGASANMGDVWWDGLVIIKQDDDLTPYTGPYFDGSTKDTQYADYEWTGAAHASTSIIRGLSSTENVKIRYRPVWL